MTVSSPDGVFTFGSGQVQQVPASGPGAANDLVARAILGSLYRENGKVWRYVQFDNGSGNVTADPFEVVHWKSLDPVNGTFIVTNDYSSGLGANLVAGVLGVRVTDLYYTWMQVGGIATVYVDFTSLSGDPVAASVAGCKCVYSTVDTKIRLIAPTTNPAAVVYGVLVATANYTANTGSVLLQNLEW